MSGSTWRVLCGHVHQNGYVQGSGPFAGPDEANTSLLCELHPRSVYLKPSAAHDHMRLAGKVSTCSNDSR